MKIKQQVITIVLSVFITLAVGFGVQFGIKSINDSNIAADCDETSSFADQFAKRVSLIQLIATPEKYDGEFVRVIGVGNLEFEGNYVSLSKEDWKYSLGNCIWLEFGDVGISYEEAAQYNGEHVIIEGIFDKDDCGHFEMFYGSIKNITRYELWDSNLTYNAEIRYGEKTHSYEVSDYKGRLLGREDNLTSLPERLHVSADVVGISVQAGTGLSTTYTRFFDLENSRASETFYYVLTAKDGYVVYAYYADGEHIIVVQDIFDKERCYQEYKLENVSPVAADFAVGGCFDNNGNITITYLAGEAFTETKYTIPIPPNKTAE